jgi:hypothetical protein
MKTQELITIIGITATFILGLINIYLSLKNNTRSVYVNSVTKLRSEWLKDLKINVSRYYSKCCNLRLSRETDPLATIKEIQEITAYIALSLNPQDDHDNEYIQLMNDINRIFSEHYDTIHRNESELLEKLDELLKKMKKYTKLEWEGIKLESQKGILNERQKKKLRLKYYDYT